MDPPLPAFGWAAADQHRLRIDIHFQLFGIQLPDRPGLPLHRCLQRFQIRFELSKGRLARRIESQVREVVDQRTASNVEVVICIHEPLVNVERLPLAILVHADRLPMGP